MTPAELKQARRKLGLTLSQMAAMLGYDGTHAAQQIRKMESYGPDNRAIREPQRRLMDFYLKGQFPDDWPA